MDADLKAKWIAALRSGEFKQAQKRLKSGDAYCCLGVLAIVHDKNADLRDDEGENDVYAQLDEMVGRLSRRIELVSMNDKEGKTFAEIADYVERNIEPIMPRDGTKDV